MRTQDSYRETSWVWKPHFLLKVALESRCPWAKLTSPQDIKSSSQPNGSVTVLSGDFCGNSWSHGQLGKLLWWVSCPPHLRATPESMGFLLQWVNQGTSSHIHSLQTLSFSLVTSRSCFSFILVSFCYNILHLHMQSGVHQPEFLRMDALDTSIMGFEKPTWEG